MLEEECIGIMGDMPGVLSTNVRLAVSEYEHRNASVTRPSSVYLNIVRRELQIESYSQWQAQWAAHQLANHGVLPLRILGMDSYSQGTSAFHRGTDKYSQGTSKYHTGDDKLTLGTARPQPTGLARKPHAYPGSRVEGLNLARLEQAQQAWREADPNLPSLTELLSQGRHRFNKLIDAVRNASPELKALIESKVSKGSIGTSKFAALLGEFEAAQVEAGAGEVVESTRSQSSDVAEASAPVDEAGIEGAEAFVPDAESGASSPLRLVYDLRDAVPFPQPTAPPPTRKRKLCKGAREFFAPPAPPGARTRQWVSSGLAQEGEKVWRVLASDDACMNKGWHPTGIFRF